MKNTIGHLFLEKTQTLPHKKAIGFISENQVTSYSFKEYKNKVEILTLALIRSGIISQDKVCILSQTCIEWNFFDLAILCSGAITVPIYHTNTSSEVEFIISQTEAKCIIIEDDIQFLKVYEKLKGIESLKVIVSIHKLSTEIIQKLPSHINYFSIEDFNKIGTEELTSNPDLFEIKINSQHDNNIASIVYTSGTTGDAKGVVIRHGALIKMLKNIKDFTDTALSHHDTNLIFLPLSHVLGRCDSFLNITFGCNSIYAESIDNLLVNIQLCKPTFMIAVPRIFEKIYEKTQLDLDNNTSLKGKFKKEIFSWAMNIANTYFDKVDVNKTPTANEILQFNLAKKFLFSKVYEKFGGKIRYFISGGAPLSSEVIKFLRNSGLTLVEGYGLTETIAPCVLNPFSRQKAGTVGRPIGDVEVSFTKDSEVLIRSQALFDHYYENEEQTQKVLSKENWFSTGDIGHFDKDGYLVITGRIKDIIITSGGKNIAPQKIEAKLKLSPLVEHCVIIGDKRKYLTALVGLNEENLEEFLKNNTQTIEIIKKNIVKVNSQLAKYETIKDFRVLPILLTTDNFLTPSLKVKKSRLTEAFSQLINEMY